jgi:hypothetical protein
VLPAIIAPLLVAIIDEWHQSLVPSRKSSARDVLLDLAGACVAQIVIWIVVRRRAVSSFEFRVSSFEFRVSSVCFAAANSGLETRLANSRSFAALRMTVCE